MKYLITLIFLFSASNVQADTLLEKLAKSLEKDIKQVTVVQLEHDMRVKEIELKHKLEKELMKKRLEILKGK